MTNYKSLISKIGIGTVQFGLEYGINNKNGKPNFKTISEILKLAMIEKIDLIDTARNYGTSENAIGQFLLQNKGIFKIVTKFKSSNEKELHKSISDSLSALNVDSLYALLFHDFSDYKNNTSLLTELGKYQKNKIVNKIGFSLYFPDQLDYLFNHEVKFDIIQIPFNIFDRRFEKYFDILKEKKIEIHTRSIFLQGLFFKDLNDLPDHFLTVKNKLKHLHMIADKYNFTIAELSIGFALAKKQIDRIIVGVDSIENLKDNISTASKYKYKEEIIDDLLCLAIDDEQILLPMHWRL